MRVLVVNAYEVSLLLSGGHRRIKDLYTSLSPYLEIGVCTIGGDPFSGGYRMLGSMSETCVPRSIRSHAETLALERYVGVSGSHACTDRTVRHNAAFIDELRWRLRDVDVVVTCHPYLYPLLRSMWTGPIVYHSHDVEAALQEELLPKTSLGIDLLADVVRVEAACVRDSSFTITMSPEDADRYVDLYGVARDRMVPVPPSLTFRGGRLPDIALRAQEKQRMIGTADPLVVFMGSNWGPNITGALQILEMARALPAVKFVLLGDVEKGLPPHELPMNLKLTGFVSEEMKRRLLLAADVALNPTVASSGVNMKMGEYFLAGAPVVTTPDGARGLALQHGETAWIVESQKFPDAIVQALRKPREARRRAQNAYNHAREYFDESTNAVRLAKRFEELSDLSHTPLLRLTAKVASRNASEISTRELFACEASGLDVLSDTRSHDIVNRVEPVLNQA